VTDGQHLLVLFIRAAVLVILGLNLYYRLSASGGSGPGWL
jgi:hypothetical protein